VLCDGITYAQNKGARLVIDLATLTYSAQAALGDQIVGLFTNEEEMNQRWMEMAGQTGEKFWRLPLDAYYHNLLNWSICADFANYAPGKGGGASVAACFLENFIEEGTRWIHLDMVGPSVVRSQTDELAEGASGACIDTIVRFLE
jgi:leucyl aminopeptidase